ncbi:hypothetical protein ThrDRAFT_02630 [Frankia casuarinae]|uniref:hypothetical protein n=1 Tax=Frankia TaxID=1854 RepID=UPI0003D02248|nr:MULTISPECIES: hypothetical protein [Frankia]ETA01665.1 hypothetical protein CcI6DRAFT_02845 [Frankia sp. CcI6]EYT91743.1 hypothetical protein ThrDRAFT_02630 [Frankia casuarinae]KDA42375.1 hypothetical protein BMG523Draft_02766 [Frankia sp. BMG5.23]KEZ35098.1 hypothetical protein CEDDRAFT_03509 [Frankia sp. CeD]KFB03892.1 hypothetical protein ALLO2DRAFT_03408 [Frankia sp. Allo2]
MTVLVLLGRSFNRSTGTLHQPAALDNSARAWAVELARAAWRMFVVVCLAIEVTHCVLSGRKRPRHRRLPSIRPP